MVNRYDLKIILFFLFCSAFVRSVLSQVADNNGYITIDQTIEKLEQQFPVRFYYLHTWFDDRKIHSSVLEFPFGDIIDRIKSATGLSVITIDSVLYVFVPELTLTDASSDSERSAMLVIGNALESVGKTRAVLSGKILDGKTGMALPGASVYVEELKLGISSDEKGYYRIALPLGEYHIKTTFLSYEASIQPIKLAGDGLLDLELFENTTMLDEVVISHQRADLNISGTQMGTVKLDSRTIRELPVSLGEKDIIKSLALMPGIQTIGELGTGFNVRGGGADQNLVLLEDVPIFNTSHLFGLVSVVNSDGISNATLLKAGIPAKYGERASSVMDIQLGAGNPGKTSVKGSIGLISSKLYLETPLFHNKISLLTGARTSYSNWLMHRLPDADLINSSTRFYDADIYLSYNVNATNKINLFTYISKDKLGFSRNSEYRYGNLLASLRWKHTFNTNLYLNLMAGISQYQNEFSETDQEQFWDNYKIHSSIRYNNLKGNVTWLPHRNHTVDFGLNTALYRINPGELSPSEEESQIAPVQIHAENAIEYALYLSDNMTIAQKLSLDIGLRYNFYNYLGPNKVYVYQPGAPISHESIIDSFTYADYQSICTYSGPEPRISLRYAMSENNSLKLSYNRIHQHIQLISNTAVMMPSDVWKLSSPNLGPLTSDQVSLGYYHNFRNNTLETSVEVYYKNIDGAIDYKNGARIILNPYLESDLVNVNGINYGIEFYVKKNSGRLTGWASYTFSRSFHRTESRFEVERINDNNAFPTSYDKPNNLVINASYHFSKRWRFGGSFLYSTGRPLTLPELKYTYQDYQLIHYSDRNKYRLPDYHRLDFYITLDESLSIKKKWKGSWTFSIINLYGRKNAYSVFYQKEDHMVTDELRQYDTYMMYILGRPLPTLTYNFTF